MLESRKSEGEAGRLLIQRGLQKLKAGHQYDAIRILGRAENNLIKHEYRHDLVAALVGCGLAYERAGLLWAARMNFLAAATQVFSDFHEYGSISTKALRCVLKLVWLEMQLGRVPAVLCWTELADVIAFQLKLEDAAREEYQQERNLIDTILGLLILATPLNAASKALKLPDILDSGGFHLAATAALYVLGYEKALREGGWIPEQESETAVHAMFLKWKNQPAKDDLPAEPEYVAGDETRLQSAVLGTRIVVRAANNIVTIQLAETLLAVLEAFLATSAGYDGLLPYREELNIEIKPSELISGLPEMSVSREHGEEVIRIHHRTTAISTVEERLQLRDRIMEIIAEILPRIAVGKDIEQHLEKIAREEGAITRSLAFSEISVCVENILGNSPKVRLSDWEVGKTLEEYPLLRDEPWDADDRKEKPGGGESIWSKGASGESPPELRQRRLKHSARRVASVIDLPLWNKAQWHSALFAYSLEPYATPYLALGFRDSEAGKQIFQDLREKLGDVDAEETLRISIITGVDTKHPLDYTVGISRNLTVDQLDDKMEFVMVMRSCRMHPQDGRNLNGFLERYHRTRTYRLAPAHFNEGAAPQCFFELGIAKKQLIVRPAWQIGMNDPDIMVLDADSEPIIPEDVKDAPVLRAIEMKRRMRDRQ